VHAPGQAGKPWEGEGHTGTTRLREGWLGVMIIPETHTSQVDIGEAARQLQSACHDARVAYDCIDLGDLDLAHINAITARAAADAAETILRTALGEGQGARGEL
jgi:hypothetical protein